MALSDFKPMQERCSNCSFCKWIPFDKVKNARFAENCPSVCYHHFNTYSARGRFQIALAMVNGEKEVNGQMTDIAHACLSCGACDVSCKICRYNLEPLEHNVALKAHVVENGGILPVQKIMTESLRTEKTMLPGRKKADRAAWLQGMEVQNVFDSACEVLYYPGCKYSYDEKLQATAREGLQLLIDCGVNVGVMGAYDVCCAGRAWQQGLMEDFESRAQDNIRMIEKSGVKCIVTPCSDCYHAFKRLYPKLGLKVEVLHLVEYIDRLIQEGKMTFTRELNLSVTYHDPCHLGRQGEPYVAWDGVEKKIRNQIHTWEPRRPRYNGAHGIYDAPRNILKALPGVQLIEMDRIREYSWCCGAGAACELTTPEMSQWTADERMTEAESTGADVLVTACPWCQDRLSRASGEDGRALPVRDILELVRKAL